MSNQRYESQHRFNTETKERSLNDFCLICNLSLSESNKARKGRVWLPFANKRRTVTLREPDSNGNKLLDIETTMIWRQRLLKKCSNLKYGRDDMYESIYQTRKGWCCIDHFDKVNYEQRDGSFKLYYKSKHEANRGVTLPIPKYGHQTGGGSPPRSLNVLERKLQRIIDQRDNKQQLSLEDSSWLIDQLIESRKMKDRVENLEIENAKLKVNLEELTAKLEAADLALANKISQSQFMSWELLRRRATNSDMYTLTGMLSVGCFEKLHAAVLKSVKSVPTRDSLTSQDDLLISLMRLRTFMGEKTLAILFGCDQSRVSLVFNRWMPVLSKCLDAAFPYPTSANIRSNYPDHWRDECIGFGHDRTVLVVDSTNVYVAISKDPAINTSTHSKYYGKYIYI